MVEPNADVTAKDLEELERLEKERQASGQANQEADDGDMELKAPVKKQRRPPMRKIDSTVLDEV